MHCVYMGTVHLKVLPTYIIIMSLNVLGAAKSDDDA